MVDIGGKPILWHILKTYSHHGFRKFILCLGYKSELIKRYFLDMREHASDFTLDLARDRGPSFLGTNGEGEDWQITFAETGLATGTGARIVKVLKYIDTPTFALSYGDGIGDIDLTKQLIAHRKAERLATVTGVHPTSRFGEMRVEDESDRVLEFNEKPTNAAGWVSGGFFLFEREFADKYLDDDPNLLLEHAPLQRVARDGQLSVFRHEGFWMGMDTYRDWTELNQLWDSGEAPWAVWKH
jgi:glucose-1-phosphate cytidylyltransferase